MVKILASFLLLFICIQPAFSYSSVNREVNRINYEMQKTKREIARVKASKSLSEIEKRRKLRKLEYKLYSNKRAIRQIRT